MFLQLVPGRLFETLHIAVIILILQVLFFFLTGFFALDTVLYTENTA